MLADFSTVNLGESSVVWEAKESSSAVLLGRGEADVRMLRWPRDKRFTVLEDFVLRVIERELGHSDKEIARALCLEEQDIDVIVNDGALQDEIEGDSTRRTLPSDFTRRDLDGVAFAVGGEVPPDVIQVYTSDLEGVIKLINNFGRPAGRSNLSKSQKKWMEENDARLVELPVEAFCYDAGKTWVFLCGGQLVSPALNDRLSKLKPFHGIGEKSAPSGAVCHRDEFWPWLKHRIGKEAPKRIVFESARHDDDAAKWLREEMKINAELRDVQNKGPESVCLGDERFALRGDFVCRA